MNLQFQQQIKAYGMIFEVENKLRVAMHNLMLFDYGVTYSVSNLFPKFTYKVFTKSKYYDISDDILKRKNNEKEYNTMAGFVYPDFWYLDFPVIMVLVDNFWDSYFKKLFIEGNNIREDIIPRMKLLITVRNAVSHNRYISPQDMGDVQSLHTLFLRYIKIDYLLNYELLTFNKPDEIRTSICSELIELKIILNKGRVVNQRDIDKIKSLFSSLVQFRPASLSIGKILEEFIEILDKYNKTLPRKPGRKSEIDSFLENNNMFYTLDHLINSVRQA